MISIQVNVCVLCQKFPVLPNKYTKHINYIRGEITFAKYIKSSILLYFYNQNFYLFDLDLTALLVNFQNVSGDNLPLYTSNSSEWGKTPCKMNEQNPIPCSDSKCCWETLWVLPEVDRTLAITAHVCLLSCPCFHVIPGMGVTTPRNLPF